ncbi:MAG TPA: DNA polymerase III subunit delta' [Bauldia sp.]|nr:DNA polymerase III subunit delta' [Bauldia sp.]
MPAAAEADDDLIRFDRVEGWPAPEEQPDWFGAPEGEQALLDAYRSGRMHHAWLLGGPKGIGKATLAYRFARFVLAYPDPKAPEVAAAVSLAVPSSHPAFRKVASRAHPNLLVLERPWDEQNKRFKTVVAVDEVRKTVGFFGTTGGENNWRVAVVDPADDMNASSENALLKVLEEPPARSLFLLVSHAPGRLLPTIRSRTRRLDVAPLPPETIVSAIQAHGEPDEDLPLVASLAEGSLRRAILLMEGGGIETYRALGRLLARLPNLDIAAAHAFADSVSGRGDDDAWVGFGDMLAAWLNRRVRGQPEPEAAVEPGPGVQAVPLERWAEVWETLRQSVFDTDELNLDRKRTVLSILMALARATRM